MGQGPASVRRHLHAGLQFFFASRHDVASWHDDLHRSGFFFSRIATLANPEVKSFCSQLELSELVIKNQDIIYFRFWCEGHLFWRYWKSPGDQSHRGRLRLLTDWSCQFRAMCCPWPTWLLYRGLLLPPLDSRAVWTVLALTLQLSLLSVNNIGHFFIASVKYILSFLVVHTIV